MSNTFLTLVKRAFDLSQKPFRPRPKTKEVSKNDINIHIIAYYTISNTTLGRDSLSVVYIYESPITGFFNTQSTYFRTRQVMDGDREVIHKKGHVSLLYRLIINMIS